MEQENNKWDLRMYKRYVDDTNLIIKVKVHEEQDTTTTDNRMREEANNIKELADSVMPKTIMMEVDLPSNHGGGKMPILDLECWVNKDNNVEKHQFFRKLMTTTKVIM